MASSASSASPAGTFLNPPAARSESAQTSDSEPSLSVLTNSPANRAIERSHISSVARDLRTRLSYASYKATHNLPRATLVDLEKQPLPGQGSSAGRQKRKAPGSTNYYNNPATQGGPQTASGANARRSHYPNAGGQTATSTTPNGSDILNGYGRDGQSLFTAILAPPSTTQTRTIMNPLAPPVNAAVRPPPAPASPRVPKGARLISSAPRTISRGVDRSPPKGGKGSKADPKGKQKETSRRGKKGSNDVADMQAAAALAGLMKRPSMASDAGSDAGSVASYSQFRGSARTSRGEAPRKIARMDSPNASPGPSRAMDVDGLGPALDVPDRQGTSTPGPRPTDDEAADFLMFLATSPSPARKSRNERDEAAFRQLGSMSRPSKALFRPADAPPSNPLPSRVTSASPQRSSGLARNAPGYSSSMSSIGSELEPRAAPPMIPRPASTNPTSSTTSSSSHTAHPILPSSSVPSSPSRKDTANLFPSDYPGSSSLRMDVGRRLFEGQQHRFAPRPPDQVQESDRRSLGPPAGIHG